MQTSKFSIWFMTARPKTLMAAISPVFLGSAFAIARKEFTLIVFLLTFLAAILVQILTNFANDYFDVKKGADTEERIGPKRGLHKNLISMNEMKLAIAIVTALIVVTSSYLIYLGGALIFLLMVVSIALAILYTAGRYSLAYTGLADIFCFFFFGPIAMCATYWLQSGKLDMVVFLSSIGPGCISTAILTVNNMRDIEHDRKAKKMTLVARFGLTFGKVEYLILLIGAAIAPFWIWLFYPKYSAMFIVTPLMLTAIPIIVQIFRAKSPTEIGRHLFSTSFLLMTYTLVYMFAIFYANR